MHAECTRSARFYSKLSNPTINPSIHNQRNINRQMTRSIDESMNAEYAAKISSLHEVFFLQFLLHDLACNTASCSSLLKDHSQPQHPTLARHLAAGTDRCHHLTPQLCRTSLLKMLVLAKGSRRSRAMERPSSAQFPSRPKWTRQPNM